MRRTNLLRALIICLLSTTCSSVKAQTEFPQKLSGFLDEGMNVGLNQTPGDENRFEIYIWTDVRFQMEVDARTLKFDELASKYPSISKNAQKLLAQRRSDPKLQNVELQVAWSPQFSPSVVTFVGADYILIKDAVNKEVRMAFRSERISAIRWGLNEPTLMLDYPNRTKR